MLRSLAAGLRRVITARFASTAAAAAEPNKVPGEEQATGMERVEIEAKKAGLDVFSRDPLRGPFGTADKPAVIPSHHTSRFVGCVGGAGDLAHELLWFNLYEGHPRSCSECGQVFVLNKVSTLDDFVKSRGLGSTGGGHHH